MGKKTELEVDRIISLVWLICCAVLALFLVPNAENMLEVFEFLVLIVLLYIIGGMFIISFWNNIVRGHGSHVP